MQTITIRSKYTNRTETYPMEDPTFILNRMGAFSGGMEDDSIHLVDENEERIRLLYIYDKWLFIPQVLMDIFKRAMSIVRRTEITSNYFLKEENFHKFPCNSMFSLIGAMVHDFRDMQGRYDPNAKMKQFWIEYILSDNMQIGEDSILNAETEAEAAYVYMYLVIRNLESGHIKLRE